MDDDNRIRQGQRYRTLKDLKVLFLTQWSAPYTGGGEGILPAGSVFTIELDPPAHAMAASCRPENYAEVERRMVPEDERTSAKYGGFTLVIDLDVIRTQCQLMESP